MKHYYMAAFLVLPSFVLAQSPSTVPSTPDQRVIIVDTESKSNAINPAPFVESGSDIIAGAPQENLKAAYRSWEEKCEIWKKDLDRLNGKNLLIRSCGSAKTRTEKIQLATYYTVESKAEYKIKVGCSD